MCSEQVTVVCLAPLKYIFVAIFRDTPRWPFWPYLAIDSNLVKSMFFSKVRLRQKEHKNNRYKFRAWMWCYKTHPNVHCHPYFPWLDRGPAPRPRNRSVFRNCLGGPICLSWCEIIWMVCERKIFCGLNILVIAGHPGLQSQRAFVQRIVSLIVVNSAGELFITQILYDIMILWICWCYASATCTFI